MTKKKQPDVAGALQAVRAKKSRAQIKAERFQPFAAAVGEARAMGWSWSAIIKLVREHDGPSLTKQEAEALYARLKGPDMVTDMAADTNE